MDYIKPIELAVRDKLRTDREYRNAYFRAETADAIALQLRALRRLRKMNQIELADAAEMRQSAISRIEQSEYSSWTFNTLWRVAEALDARLVVTFETAEDAVGNFVDEPQEAVASTSAKTGDALVESSHVGTYTELVAGSARTTKFSKGVPDETSKQGPLTAVATETAENANG